MTHQALYELADREIQLGIFDRALMAEAMQEAAGVEANAQQIYWRLRASTVTSLAQELSAEEREEFFRDLELRVEARERPGPFG